LVRRPLASLGATPRPSTRRLASPRLRRLAQAGIRATLHARASGFAAANPTCGRYDRSKPLAKNLTLSAPIMSRSDLFSVILDECDEVADSDIARHIVQRHPFGSLARTANTPELSSAQVRARAAAVCASARARPRGRERQAAVSPHVASAAHALPFCAVRVARPALSAHL